MKKQKFIYFLSHPEWILKLFFLFDPIEQQNSKNLKAKALKRNRIANKIFETFASEEEKSEAAKFPHFVSFKTEFTLKFFYERTKTQNNVRILRSIRILLIATMMRFDV